MIEPYELVEHPTPAFDRLLGHVQDAFRPERQEHQDHILTACRLRELVISHRMTFPQALERLEARVDWMLEAFDYVALDNVALNQKHETAVHQLAGHEAEAWRWLRQITGEAS